MSDGGRTFVIVGGGLAGAKAAESLRKQGFDGRVVLLSEESVRPYERPPLSKAYLRGEAGFDKAAVHKEAYYADHGIELRTGEPVASLDPEGRRVILASGEAVGYDSLLLATGSAPRRLPVPGSELPNVRYLRDLPDADGLRAAIEVATKVAVIGAGWIGAEVTASARQMGREVAMVEVTALPLERVLGPEVGAVYRDLHADHGVELHLGSGVEELRGSGSVEEVRLAGGKVIAADLVVVGVGVRPRVELAEEAGLPVDNGVLVDEHLAAAPGIFAAGDVANAHHPFYGGRIRLEHWSAALNQGKAVAVSMLGQPMSYDRIPYFYSDQYDLGMEYTGWAPAWDRVVLRGDPSAREFVAFWLDAAGRVLAGLNANVWDVTGPIESLVRSRRPVDVGRLTDPGVELSALAGEG